jgi:hypothetical protein
VRFPARNAFWAQRVLMPFVIVFNFVAAKFRSLRRGSGSDSA